MITDLIFSLAFYVAPYLTGRFFTKNPVFAWLIGGLVWFFLFFPISWICSWFGLDFSSITRVIIVAVSIFSLGKIFISLKIKRPKVEDKWLIAGLIIFSSLIYFLIWKRNTPYPLQLNWDIYEHITLANLIAQGKIAFLTSTITDTFTFNSYSPLFHVLLSIPQIIFQKSLLGIYWWLEYWFYLLIVIGSFVTALKLFNSKFTALAAGLVASLVFESMVVYSPLFLIPQTLVALVTVLVFKDLREIKPKYLFISGLFIFLLHYVVGFWCILVLAVSFLAYRQNLSKGFLNLVTFLSVFIASLLVASNFLGSWQVIEQEEAGHFTFQLWEKAGFILDWYGVGLIVLMLLGFIKIVKSQDVAQKLVLIFAILLLGVALAPISYFIKFYALGGYFVNLVIASGIGFLFLKLPKPLKALGLGYLVIILMLVFYKNQLVYKIPLHYKNFETQMSMEEVKAGEWLSQNKEEDYFLISDPGTQYILEAVSGVNTQGGAYMSLGSRQNLVHIKNSRDSEFIKKRLSKIQDKLDGSKKQIIFVVGGRYFIWQKLPLDQKESTFYNVWSPRPLTKEDESYVDFLENHFELLYKNDELAIFKI